MFGRKRKFKDLEVDDLRVVERLKVGFLQPERWMKVDGERDVIGQTPNDLVRDAIGGVTTGDYLYKLNADGDIAGTPGTHNADPSTVVLRDNGGKSNFTKVEISGKGNWGNIAVRQGNGVSDVLFQVDGGVPETVVEKGDFVVRGLNSANKFQVRNNAGILMMYVNTTSSYLTLGGGMMTISYSNALATVSAANGLKVSGADSTSKLDVQENGGSSIFKVDTDGELIHLNGNLRIFGKTTTFNDAAYGSNLAFHAMRIRFRNNIGLAYSGNIYSEGGNLHYLTFNDGSEYRIVKTTEVTENPRFPSDAGYPGGTELLKLGGASNNVTLPTLTSANPNMLSVNSSGVVSVNDFSDMIPMGEVSWTGSTTSYFTVTPATTLSSGSGYIFTGSFAFPITYAAGGGNTTILSSCLSGMEPISANLFGLRMLSSSMCCHIAFTCSFSSETLGTHTVNFGIKKWDSSADLTTWNNNSFIFNSVNIVGELNNSVFNVALPLDAGDEIAPVIWASSGTIRIHTLNFFCMGIKT